MIARDAGVVRVRNAPETWKTGDVQSSRATGFMHGSYLGAGLDPIGAGLVRFAEMESLIHTFVTSFGPIGFGVFATILIWYIIVAPHLRSAKIDAHAFGTIADRLKEASLILDRTSQSISASASAIERVMIEMRALMDRIEALEKKT